MAQREPAAKRKTTKPPNGVGCDLGRPTPQPRSFHLEVPDSTALGSLGVPAARPGKPKTVTWVCRLQMEDVEDGCFSFVQY